MSYVVVDGVAVVVDVKLSVTLMNKKSYVVVAAVFSVVVVVIVKLSFRLMKNICYVVVVLVVRN